MEIHRSICCKELMKLSVIGAKGQKVGHINDFTFTFNGSLNLSQFILGGGMWEELLESLKLRPNKDPIFNASLIEKIGDQIHLNTDVESLKTTLDECAISDDEIRLSELSKLAIFDEDGVKIGNVIDVDFDVDGKASLIVGGGFVEEKLESLGIKPDIDIIVPDDVIESISDKIQLMVSKDELESTLEDVLREHNPAVQKVKDERMVLQDGAKVRLWSQRPY